jgi:multidrug resistance protein, MATE family
MTLTHGHSEILRLALPNIVTNLTVPLLSIVDLHLMGHLNNELYMGAVAMGVVVFNFVLWGFAFLRMSISGISAQYYGANNQQANAHILWQGLTVTLVASVLLLIFQVPIIKASLMLMDGSPEVKVLAADYFRWRIWAAPAIIAQMVFMGWFLGQQNAIIPMVVSILVNVLNIAMSFIAVKQLNMGIQGVALASVFAQSVGVIVCIAYLNRRYAFVKRFINFVDLFRVKSYRYFLNVSGDIFLRTLCVIAVFTFFTSQSAGMGNAVLAANSALLQFLFLFAYFLDGFAFAAEAIVGRLVGGNQHKALKKAVRKLFIWGILFAVIFSLVYFGFSTNILGLITNNHSVLDVADDYVVWIIFLPLASFMSFVWDGVYIGATASKAMRNTMLFSTLLFFFLPYYLLKPIFFNHAIWVSMLSFFLMRGVSQTILASRVVFGK